MKTWFSLACCAAAVLACASARADDGASPVKFDAGIGTEFPISMGLTANAELPHRVLVRLDVGWMPQPYAYTVNAFLEGIGVYDDAVAALIKTALSNSFVLHPAVGWRPFEHHGFEATVGYTLVTLGGSLDGADVVNVFLQESGSKQTIDAKTNKQVDLDATLHNFQLTVGWRWLLWQDRLALRADVSYLQCFAASSGISLPSAPTTGRRGAAAAALQTGASNAIDSYLSPYFTSYVKTPVLGVSLAYRFAR